MRTVTTIAEAYGELFTETFALPLVGHSPVLGFLQDLIAVAVLASLVVFAVIRVRESPARLGRASRFYGSHTGQAWVILAMVKVFSVVFDVGTLEATLFAAAITLAQQRRSVLVIEAA